MKTIWKFPLVPTDSLTVRMPRGAELLSVQTQGEVPHIWAMVDDQAPRVGRRLAIFGTGHHVASVDLWQYVGTFQLEGGALVFHVFDLGEMELGS